MAKQFEEVEHELTGKEVTIRRPSWTNKVDGQVFPAKLIKVNVFRVVKNNYFIQHAKGELMLQTSKGGVYYPLSYIVPN